MIIGHAGSSTTSYFVDKDSQLYEERVHYHDQLYYNFDTLQFTPYNNRFRSASDAIGDQSYSLSS